MLQDSIADLLTQLRNATRAKRRYIDISWSKMKESIVKLLREKGYLAHYLIKEENKKGVMRIFLSYGPNQEPLLEELKRCSKPSRRLYVSYKDIPQIRGKIGMTILSTSRGVMDGVEARQQKLGGELICMVY